jgi:UDP-N-acetylmuramate dehydrogenase
MNQDSMVRALSARTKGELLLNEPMCRHTSFRIGGPADVFFTPEDEDDFKTALAICRQHRVPVTVIGGGTNLLVSDLGVDGVVLCLAGRLNGVSVQETSIKAGAGALLNQVSSIAAIHSLSGLEFATGIPGTVAGAVAMNSAAFGRRMSDAVASVRACTLDGRDVILSADDCRFGEKSSVFLDGQYVILEVVLGLRVGDPCEIGEARERFIRERSAKQPLNHCSAGCVFRNPKGEGAGRYIDLAGCKGLRVGDAEVSRLHANFIVNLGCATAADVMQLIDQVRGLVASKVGVRLEPEIRFIGRQSAS